MKFIEFILGNLLRFKYLGILAVALLPTVFLDQTFEAFNYSRPAIYILAAIVCFLLFSVRYTSQISCIIVLSLFYNFLFLQHKNDLSEFLFIAVFYLSIHVILLNRSKLRYVIPVLLAVAIIIKPIGIALLLAYLVYLLFFKFNTKKQKAIELGVNFLIIVLVIFGMKLIPGMNHYFTDLPQFTGFDQFGIETMSVNCKLYPAYILHFFDQDLPGFIKHTIQFVCVVMFLLGLYFSVKNQFGIIDMVLFAYVMCLFLLPGDGNAGFSQFAPIVPLVFYYMANSILSASNFLVLYLQHRFAIWFFLILMISNAYSLWLIYHV